MYAFGDDDLERAGIKPGTCHMANAKRHDAALWEKRLAEDPQLMEMLGPVMALAVDEGILSAEAEFEKLTDEEYDECLAQVAPVLGAVDHYWHEHPATEAELAVLAQPAAPAQDTPPPRHRSGHWVH